MHVLKVLGCIAALLVTCVSAGSSEWKRQLAGLDGVATWCVDHADGKYGKALCDKIQTSISAELKKNSIPVETFGYVRVDAQQAIVPKTIKSPLNLVLIIRGTAGNTAAIQLRWRASVTYVSAVEAGSNGEGRSGELVLHEKSYTGSGPVGELEKAIGDAMVAYISTVFEDMLPSWDKS